MSEEKVLDTNSIITALSTEMDDLKEAWRKYQKTFFSDIYAGRSQQHRKQFTSEILLIYHQKYTQYRIPSFK